MSDDPTHLIHDGTANQAERNNIITTMTCAPNITQVANNACNGATNLISIDLPEGITIIGYGSFNCCISLKEIKFPKSLTKIGSCSFANCSSVEKVDLLHTKVQELGENAFSECTSLREMKVPNSLQTFDDRNGGVFRNCSKLVPSDINSGYGCNAKAIVTYLRAQVSSRPPPSKKRKK